MSYHGLLLVNKPGQITSHDVVQRVRRAIGSRDVGHAGTLDPLATGLMVLLLGEGTKISDYVLNGAKAYKVRVKLGVRTDSLDVTGAVLTEQAVDLTEDQIRNAALALQGIFQWPIPMFSAAKVKGEKLYDLARKGIDLELIPNKEMQFSNVQVLEVGPNYVDAHLECSKGSFIRSWAAELGERLGVGGAVERLERTHSTPYSLDAAAELTDIEGPRTQWDKAFIPLKKSLPHWRTVTVKGKDARLILNGQVSYDLERRLIPELKEAAVAQNTVGIKVLNAESGDLLAILEAQPNRGLKIRRVFKNA
jgi:tRNA pseudouridine55 synthase